MSDKNGKIKDYAKAIKELCQKFSCDGAGDELQCNCPFYKNDGRFGAWCGLTVSHVNVPKWWEVDSHED